VSRTEWCNGLLLAAVVGLAKADAAAVGVVAPALRSELHVTEAQLGLIASISSGTGALCALPAGVLVDRRRRVALVTAALVVWSLSLGTAAFATGLVLLAVARLASGGVATVARPMAVSMAGDIYKAEDRGRALAYLDAGQAVGAALCFLLGALAVEVLSWRWLFVWLAAGGLLLAVLARSMEDPVQHRRSSGPPLSEVLRRLLRIRTNVIVLAADSVGNFFYAGAATFSVLFVTERYGLTTATVDSLAPVIGVGVIVGILAGGRVGDRLTRSGGGARRLAVASSCQLTATVLFAAALMSATVVAAGLLLFAAATVLGGAGPCLDAVRVDIVDPAMRGRAESARGLLMLGSSALGPVTFGLVATYLGGRGGIALRDAFLIMLVPLAAGALILLAARITYQADAVAAGTVAPRGMLEG
jgi:predicted MFS family arabinose efflux permease